MSINRVIWQYWETKGDKPKFIDGLRDLAEKNSGVKVVLVTPENLKEYLPDVPKELSSIEELAHKADMIRTMLIYSHGGMWLDSDAIVLSDLNWIFDQLEKYDFVGFDHSTENEPPSLSINCFAAKVRSEIMSAWIQKQHQKFPRIKYEWSEIGTDLLNPIVVDNIEKVKLFSYDIICPIKWNQVKKFSSRFQNSKKILENSKIVMLSNKSLQKKNPKLTKMSLADLTQDKTLIADIIKKALDNTYEPSSRLKRLLKLNL